MKRLESPISLTSFGRCEGQRRLVRTAQGYGGERWRLVAGQSPQGAIDNRGASRKYSD